MNKKASLDGIILFLILIFLLSWLIGNWFKSTTPYNTFMEDCKTLNEDKYPCSKFFYALNHEEECNNQILNQTELLKLTCQNKYLNLNFTK